MVGFECLYKGIYCYRNNERNITIVGEPEGLREAIVERIRSGKIEVNENNEIINLEIYVDGEKNIRDKIPEKYLKVLKAYEKLYEYFTMTGAYYNYDPVWEAVRLLTDVEVEAIYGPSDCCGDEIPRWLCNFIDEETLVAKTKTNVYQVRRDCYDGAVYSVRRAGEDRPFFVGTTDLSDETGCDMSFPEEWSNCIEEYESLHRLANLIEWYPLEDTLDVL